MSALSRPLIVKHLVAAAREHGGSIVAHGCTGKGNDQVRFEVGLASLAPDLEVLAPVRDYAWTLDKAVAFAEETRSRSTSASGRRSRSTRTYEAERWRPASSGTCGTRPPRTSTTTPRTRPSTRHARRDRHQIRSRRFGVDGGIVPVSVLPAMEEWNRRGGEQASAVATSSRPTRRRQESRDLRGARAIVLIAACADRHVTLEHELGQRERDTDQKGGGLVYDGCGSRR